LADDKEHTVFLVHHITSDPVLHLLYREIGQNVF
jgi:hypothetical protein